MIGILLISAALEIASMAHANGTAVKSSCAGSINRSSGVEVNRFYADRAITIIRAGLDGDRAKLATLVAPVAKFALWRGDVGTGRQIGTAGAMEMSRKLGSTRFEVMTDRPGPISFSAVKCEWITTVLFRSQQPETAINVAFKFVDGLLVAADGYEVDLY
jgi:hypothetical protein